MTQRDALLDWAKDQVGQGRHAVYVRDALGREPTKSDLALAWCGMFCLSGLHEVGLATGTLWKLGVGFVGPLGLKTTRTPSRGDIGYKAKPFQHHFIFSHEHDGWFYGIGGNAPGVKEQRFRRDEVVFFSIDPLLDVTDQNTRPGPPNFPTLKLGSHGEPVKTLQEALNRTGTSLVVDGGFGVRTDLAVRVFQRAAGLADDGVVGSRTWEALLES